jgi:hypothetical protein
LLNPLATAKLLHQTQGTSRIEIGRNFDAAIRAMPGGLPSTHTIDYIQGVSHNTPAMFGSEAGLNKASSFTYLEMHE